MPTLPLLVISSAISLCLAQSGDGTASWPHDYPGKPQGDLSPEWQNYFLVKDPLPHVTFDLGRNWAGNMPVDQNNRPNDTFFFWGFERVNGSLTAKSNERTDEPWAIYISGNSDKTSSSLSALLTKNGPLHLSPFNGTIRTNTKSWHHLADMFWVDYHVGLGYSTAQNKVLPGSSNFLQAQDDFWSFVGNIVKVFPSLAQRPLHLIGELGGGRTVAYFSQHYLTMRQPPTKLSKITIGDGFLDSDNFGLTQSAMLSVIEAYPQLIGYDIRTYKDLKKKFHKCGFDIDLRYPQGGKITYPDLDNTEHQDPLNLYKVSVLSEDTKATEPLLSAATFLNNDTTRAAIHAPRIKDWSAEPKFSDDFSIKDISAAPLTNTLSENAASREVPIVIYNRNDNLRFPPRLSEVVIQNTTFGGVRGFSRRPSAAWSNDDGTLGGIVHQERRWTFGVIYGHTDSASVYSFLREFVFGNNQTGLVSDKDNSNVQGSKKSTLAGPLLQGPDDIWVTNGTQTSTYIAPSQTIAAWNSYFSSAIATPVHNGASTSGPVTLLWTTLTLLPLYLGFLGI